MKTKITMKLNQRIIQKLLLSTIFVFLVGTLCSQQLPELLYYKFDASGTSVTNHASSPVGSNPATITGTALSIGSTGLSGTALVGTGGSSTSNRINTGWTTSFTGSFTIAFWTSNIPASSTLWYIWGDAGAANFRCFTNGVAGANNWMVRAGGLPDLAINGAATSAANMIHVVRDLTAGTYKAYKNGVLINTVNTTAAFSTSGTGFTIGGNGSSTGLSGKMDEFRIYNRALGQAEITATYNTTIGGTTYQTDLALKSWDYPNSSCGMSSAEPITIKVKNYGTVSQNSYTLKYSINGGTSWVSQAMTTAILPDSILTHTFTTPANFATAGTYNCLAAVILPLDSNSNNDTLSKTIIASVGMATPYFNNLESMPTGVMTTGDWISSTSSAPNWQIDVSNTSSSNTGPNKDHTLGTTAGKYAFLETSGGALGSTSYLTSPCVNFGSVNAVVFNFWYHMYGSTMGTLEVQQKVGGTWVTTGWSKTGQQHTSMGAAWSEATVSINATADGIRFKGVRGSSYYSDMAIDDIKLYTPMPNDLAMIAWTSPLAGTPPSATMPVTVQVFNAGLAAQDTIPLKYSINGGTSWVSEVSYPTLLPGDTLTYTFSATASMATPGYYSCIGVVSNPGDGAVSNDSIAVNPYLCTALTGTYLIGSGATADFPTFADAAFALANCGVGGPVVMNIDTGTYTEQVVIGAINGASATNTVTFKSLTGTNTDVTLKYAATSSAAPWTVRLNGADYIAFKNMTILATGATYKWVLDITNSDYNTFEGNILQATGAASSSNSRIAYIYTGISNYNTFLNNKLIGGYYGIYCYGSNSTTWAKGNRFEGNEISGGYYYPMYLYYQDSVQVINNYIHGNLGPYAYGIYGNYMNNEYKIIGNTINLTSTGTSTCYGIRDYYSNYYSYNASPSGYGLIANNMISISGGNGNHYGIYSYYAKAAKYYYNSINIMNGGTTSRPLYQYNTALNTPGQTFKNNIFANKGLGYAAYFNTPTMVAASDYNCYYSASNYFVYWTGNKTTLTALQTASSKDANSVNILPPFTSSTDLHLMGTALSALGTPVTAVTVDIDGTPRGLAPTIGAHEVPLLPWDAGVFNITAPTPNLTVTEGATVPLTVIVKNYGTNTITSMSIEYSVNNGTPVIYTYTGTLLPNATASVTLTSFTATAGNSNVCAKTVLVGDSNSFNDEYCQPFFGTPLKDATVLEIIEIADDCNIGLDTVQIMVQNVGIDIINGASPTLITAHYQLNGVSTIVTDTITQLINPQDTILFSFDVLGDFTVSTMDSVFNIVAWVNLVNDNVPGNDTAFSDVESYGVPNPPIVSNTSIPYASSATLTAISSDTILWYQHDTSSVPLAGGPTFITPVLTDTTTYWVQAGIKISGTGANVAPLAVASAAPACNTGACSTFNDLNFGTCGSQQVWITSAASNPGSSVNVTFVWPSTKTVNKMTIHAGQNNTRFLTGGTIQIWDGSAWVNHTTFTQAVGVCFYDIFFPNASTTKLRIIDMTVGGSQNSNVNFREIEIFEAVGGCASIRVPVVVNVGPPPPLDAGVYDITSPSGSAPGGTPTPITVRIKNYGTNTLTNAVINWSLNGVTKPSFTWTGGSVAFDSISQPITIYTDTFKGGLYNLKAWTTMPNGVTDPSPANDTANTSFTACLNGTFTIGGPTADFASFTEAVAAMDLISICGPVVFNVASGTYTEQLTITSINGGSATNTVTFQSATGVNTDVVIQYAATATNNGVVHLNGADYVKFKNLTIKATGTTYAWGVFLTAGAEHNVFDGNIIQTTVSTSGNSRGVVLYLGALNQYNTFENNVIKNGYYGIYCYGASTTSLAKGNVFEGNEIIDYYYYGTYFYYQDSLQFDGNSINNASNSGSVYGTRFYYCDNIHVVGNQINIHGTATHYGMYIYYADATAANPSLIANNFVSLTGTGTGTWYGTYLYSSTYVNVYYNSYHLTGGSLTAGRAFYQSSGTNQNYKNNIFANTGGGVALYVATPAAILSSDYNDYYVSGTNLAYWLGNRTSLAALQTANSKDTNSLSVNPVFANSSTGNLTPLSIAMDNQGTPLSILTDIFGATRSLTTPDIGAVEFTGISADLKLVSGELVNGQCLSINDSVYLTISNVIGIAVNFATNPLIATWNITGPVNSTGTILVNSGIIGVNSSLEFGGSGANMSVPGNYILSAYISANANNLFGGNDTLIQTFSLNIPVPFEVMPKNVTLISTIDTVELSAKSTFFPAGAFKITEVCHWKATTGAPSGGWPAYFLTDDYIEITGVPNSDLAGFTLEQWTTTLSGSYTFPTGTNLNSTGTAIIAVGQLGSSVPVPASYYYHGNGTFTGTFGSSSTAGRIIKDATGAIVDAVGYGNYTFPAAANVPASEWSNPHTASTSSTCGARLIGADNNTGSNWVVSSSTNRQDPNTVNTGVTVPTSQALSGFAWSYNGVVTSTNSIDTVVGPWNAAGTYKYVASYVTPCGTFRDTVNITVSLPTLSPDTTICEGDSVQLFIVLPGTSPWTIVVSDGTVNNTISGITSSPWLGYVNPTINTTYSLISYQDANSGPFSSNLSIVVTVNPSPIVSFTGLATSYCIDGMNSTLTATPAGGIFSGAGMTANIFDPAVAGVGTFDISYTFTNTSGCTTVETQSITVNPIPVVVASPDTAICFGDSTTICVLSPTLFFSEYQEGSSNNKALEIYNGTGATVYLDNYAFPNVSNAPNTVGEYEYWNTFTAGDSILDGDVYVVAHGSANAAMLAVADMTHTYLSNGDDGFALVMNDGVWNDLNSNNIVNEGEMTGFTVLDWIGNWQGDPGSGWDVAGVTNGTKEHTLVRKTEVFSGNTNWADAAGTDSLSSEWIVYPQNTFTYLGTHTAVSVSAGTYLWSNAATTQSIKVSPAVTTVYTVIVTDANSCTNTDSVVVTVNPTPAMNLGPDANVCGSESIILDAGSGTGYIYFWSDSSTAQTLTVDSTGFGLGSQTFWVMVTNTNSGCYSTDTIELTSVPGTMVDLGSNVTIKMYDGTTSVTLDAGAGFTSYLWDNMALTQTRQIIGSVVGAGIHTYYVDVTDANGCMASDTVEVTVIDDTGINGIDNDNAVSLFPNPTKGIFNLSINGISGNIDMQILDASGRLISNEKLIGVKSGYIKEFDVSYLARGIYYIKLMNNDIIKLEKLVIQ